jgi:predicted DNA-binding transcriptional regulator YafY
MSQSASINHIPMPTTELTPLVRQWLLLQALANRRNGMTVKEMSEEFEVTIRTVRRDLDTLLQVGFPISENHVSSHGRKHWTFNTESRGTSLSFSWDEAIALYLGRRYLDPLAGTLLWENINQAFRKIRACLGETALRYLEKMSDAFHHTNFGAGDYAQKSEIIDQLIYAVEERRYTLLTYHSLNSTEPFTYEVFPYGIVFHHNSLYLVAFSSDHQEIRHFKIDRIEQADPQDMKFPKPKKFNLQDHLANSFGIFQGNDRSHTVRIRFAADVARIVEESRWHHSQQLKRQHDGSLLATFELGDLHEVKSWVLSFGSKAVVLGPEELREEIMEEVQQVLSEMLKENQP